MYEYLPPLLKYGLLVVIYGFLLLVYRGLVRAGGAPAGRAAAPQVGRAAGAASLVVVAAGASSRAEVGRVTPLPHRATLGRGDDCTVCVNDDFASKRHCLIQLREGTYTVTDLDSRNGTCVNGRAVAGLCALASGDTIDIGSTRFRFEA